MHALVVSSYGCTLPWSVWMDRRSACCHASPDPAQLHAMRNRRQVVTSAVPLCDCMEHCRLLSTVTEMLNGTPEVWVAPLFAGLLWQGLVCVLSVPAITAVYAQLRHGGSGLVALVRTDGWPRHVAAGVALHVECMTLCPSACCWAILSGLFHLG